MPFHRMGVCWMVQPAAARAAESFWKDTQLS